MPVTVVPRRTSMPRRRCSSGVRAMRSCSDDTSPPIQYGMPQAEYEVHCPLSNAMTSTSAPAARLAVDAADLPAASAPATTIRLVLICPDPNADERIPAPPTRESPPPDERIP